MSSALSEYLESTSIHGLAYLSEAKEILVKSLWFVCISISFSTAAYFIHASFVGWEDNPAVVTAVGPAVVEVKRCTYMCV